MLNNPLNTIFNIKSADEFNAVALQIFQFQYKNNPIYQQYTNGIGADISKIKQYRDIPFLPISFFKTHKISSTKKQCTTIFESSGTTQSQKSKHPIYDIKLYEKSFSTYFQQLFGVLENIEILAILPSYMESGNASSLLYMVNYLIEKSEHPNSGFFFNEDKKLFKILSQKNKKHPTLLIGVSYALLDFIKKHPCQLPPQTQIMETGGMKGRKKEIIRSELHQLLKKGFNIQHVFSEYGMTELLSQAYSLKNGIFCCPPWMKILIRDVNDPFKLQNINKNGGVNVIDLANYYSCSFIATQDLGKIVSDNQFEILGRFDNSDIRGCNLLAL